MADGAKIDIKPYRSKEWKEYRDHVIRMDGGLCRRCGRGIGDGVTLHVHHRGYVKGRKPWEYPYDFCETLCGGCHAEEHGIVPPQCGWDYVGWDDLGDLTGVCERCTTPIRYVFMVSHANWSPMEVGQHCCDRLTSSTVVSEFIEERLRERRSWSGRLKRFVSSPRWRVAPDGSHQIVQDRLSVRVLPHGKSWALVIDGVRGKGAYPSVIEAKEHTFTIFESGKVQEFIERRRRMARR